MPYIRQRITIVITVKPANKNINQELQWLGSSLGLFSQRDKDKSCFRVFIELLKATKKNHALSSDELAERLTLTRGTIVHHLNRLIESGIAVHERNKYLLRVDHLSLLISEVEKDFKRIFDDLSEIAKDIDEKLQF